MERRSDHANAAGRNLVLFWPPHDIFSALLAQRAFSEETSDVSSQLGGIAIYNRDSMGWYLVVCWTETGETRCIRWEWDSTLNSQHSALVDNTSNSTPQDFSLFVQLCRRSNSDSEFPRARAERPRGERRGDRQRLRLCDSAARRKTARAGQTDERRQATRGEISQENSKLSFCIPFILTLMTLANVRYRQEKYLMNNSYYN